MGGNLSRVGAAIAIGAACLAAMGWLQASHVSWADATPATCMPDRCFCEHVRDAPVRQPSNAWSNLGFVLVGLSILAAPGLRRGSTNLAARPTLNVLYALTVVFLGVGSAAYHASMSFWGQWVDVMSMYLFPTFLGLYNLSRLRPMSEGLIAALYLGVNALLGVLLVTVPEARRYLFGVLVLALLASILFVRSRLKPRMETKYLVAGTASFFTAFGIWILDQQRIVCDPLHPVQGHAIWHLLCAATTGFLYLYFRSERAPDSAGLAERPAA
ncbi:MAG: ceramidase domain-containing protein [Myxococcales bacterium]